MKNLKTVLGLMGGAAVAAMMSTSAMAADVTLKLHHFLPPQANVPKLILDVWADKVEAASEGRIKVDRFPTMQLGGKPPELLDQSIDGVADIVWTVVGYTPGRFPSTEVFELPFMVEDARAASCAYWKMFEEHMEDGEFAASKILGTWVHGPGMLHTSEPVEAPADLKGLKIRGGSRLVNNLLTEAGATPVGMPVPAVPEGLSKGVIDGTTIPWEVTTALKIPELVENHTEFEGNALYTLTFVLAMNKAKYDGMPDDLKAVIDANSGIEASGWAGRAHDEGDVVGREAMKADGNEIAELGAAETARIQELGAEVTAEWITELTEKGLDGAALVEDARAFVAGN